MIGSVATNRRAAAFAEALDEHELDEAAAADHTAADGGAGTALPAPERLPADGGGGTTQADAGSPPGGEDLPERAQLVQLTRRLGELPAPTLDPEVKAVQRAQLVAAMEAEFASGEARARQVPEQRDARGRKGAHRAPARKPVGRLRPRGRLTKGLAAGGLGVGVAASALGGVAAASGDALPGDSLYGFKRGMEDLRLDMADEETERGLLHLDHAATRMQEARRLMERARGGAELDHESVAGVRRALAGMRNEAADGHRLLSAAYAREGSIEPMRTLSSFRSDHRDSWSRMKDRLPPQLSDVRDEVSSVFDAMDGDIEPLAGLLSEQPGQAAGGTGSERKKDESPEPRPSASSSGAGQQADDEDSPDPSGTQPQTGGLLGGGGLLDPESGHGLGEQPGSGSTGQQGSQQGPKVTLPPIVPDILPELRGLTPDD